MARFKILKYFLVIATTVVTPVTLLSGHNNNRILGPNIIVIKPELHRGSNKTTYKRSEVQTLKFNCESDMPTKWLFDKEDETQTGKIITKERVQGSEGNVTFISRLEITFTVIFSRPIEFNFSCSHVMHSDVYQKLPCVVIKSVKNEDKTELLLLNGTLVRDCLPQLPTPTLKSNCTSDLKVDLRNNEGVCKSKKIGKASCKDLDTCESFLSANIADNGTCNVGILRAYNKTNDANDTRLQIPNTPFPVIVYCVQNVYDFADWTSFILLYPIVQRKWNKFSYHEKYYGHVNESLQFYALESYESFVNISQLEKRQRKNIFADGESVRFICVAIKYLFTRGFQWKANNMMPQKFHSDYYRTHDGAYHIMLTNITLNSTIVGNTTSVTCRAPIWNSLEFAESSVKIELIPATVPETKLKCNQSKDRVYCYCESTGWPQPMFMWIPEALNSSKAFDNSSVGTNPHDRIWRVQGVFNMSAESIGIACKAQNFMGHHSSTYQLAVPSQTLVIIVSAVTVVGIILVVIVLLTYWGYQKKLVMYAEQKQNLTLEEIEEFYKGASQMSTDYEALLLPYNSDEFEIPKDKLVLDGTVLGSGQFGVVLKGNIGQLTVAVKTIKPTVDLIYFKSLLTELKILQFVGPHRNIVNLIGANTANIRKREVYLILDYCSNGNLINFLRNCRPKFIDFLNDVSNQDNTYPIYENMCIVVLTSNNLIRFAYEIASAMKHLSSKNVIHGDLAARNVLVTEDLHVKICDFGLSKQLLHYSVYVQKIDCPLPLRWMALESLQDMEFSLDSDKWSFGIVLFEIFSLGEIPYPGEQWSFESYRVLQEGYRMEKPKHSNDSIYRLMLQLWSAKPQERPAYEYVISQLKKEEELLT